MPTFLPFQRAVKTHLGSLAVCALMLSAACASRAVERSSDAARPHSPSASSGQRTIVDSGASSDAGDASPVSPATTADEPTLASPFTIILEDPYPIDARPRAANPMQAAADDEALARWNVGGTADPKYPSSRASYHPGTRVVVDTRPAKRRSSSTVGLQRGLTPERVQAQARSQGYWPFRLCFEAGQRLKKGLGGETRLAFSIGASGMVSSLRFVGSELANAKSEACLIHELRKLRFQPRPARRLDLLASIRLWPGDAELPDLPKTLSSAVAPGGEFDASLVRATVVSKQAELDACFSEARRRDATLWGRLALAIVLEVDGTVHRVSQVESHFPDESSIRCAEALLAGLVFPSVNGKPFSFVQAVRLGSTASVRPSDSTTNPSQVDAISDAGAD